MKKKSFVILAMAWLSVAGFSQNLIRVNNLEAADADYLTLQEAHNNANNGDIIYLEGSATEYSGADISKKLTIIGTGYMLNQNEDTPASKLESMINSPVNFNAGAEGSLIAGCYFVSTASVININVDTITVNRCATYHINFEDTISNILILQNHVGGGIKTASYGKITNSILSNNFVHEGISCNASSSNLQVVNNIINDYYYGGHINCSNSTISNNIICDPEGKIETNSGNTITYNLFAGDGTDVDGNKFNIDMNNVFEHYANSDYSIDGKWQLKSGSPAIGAGSNGVDCGVFGGETPYILSGLPELPYIYEASIPATVNANQGMTVTLKVRSGK